MYKYPNFVYTKKRRLTNYGTYLITYLNVLTYSCFTDLVNISIYFHRKVKFGVSVWYVVCNGDRLIKRLREREILF